MFHFKFTSHPAIRQSFWGHGCIQCERVFNNLGTPLCRNDNPTSGHAKPERETQPEGTQDIPPYVQGCRPHRPEGTDHADSHTLVNIVG